jgi:hypothetical protein
MRPVSASNAWIRPRCPSGAMSATETITRLPTTAGDAKNTSLPVLCCQTMPPLFGDGVPGTAPVRASEPRITGQSLPASSAAAPGPS